MASLQRHGRPGCDSQPVTMMRPWLFALPRRFFHLEPPLPAVHSTLDDYVYKPLSTGSELLIIRPFYPTQPTFTPLTPRPITSLTTSVVIPLPITIPTKSTETSSSSSDTTNNAQMQSEHVTTKSEDFSNDEFLSVFTMSGDYLAPAPGPSMSSQGHRRNHSSESTSSLVERSTPLNRTHPSLPYARTSPNTAPTSLPGQDMRYLTAVPPAYMTSASSSSTPRTRRRGTPSEEDDDDYVDDLPPNATDQERAEHKRRLNTLAARRSRRRRLAEFQRLNDDVTRLSRECDIWKERAMMMARLMSAQGISYPALPGMSLV